MNKELIDKIITYNYNEFGNEFGDCIVDMKKEIKRLKEEYMILQNASDEVEEEKDKEIERLKQGYCELKEKCNKGECDCTHEEYNNMCEENIKMDLEIERLNNIINEFNNFIEEVYNHINLGDESDEFMLVFDKWQELKGSDKE